MEPVVILWVDYCTNAVRVSAADMSNKVKLVKSSLKQSDKRESQSQSRSDQTRVSDKLPNDGIKRKDKKVENGKQKLT